MLLEYNLQFFAKEGPGGEKTEEPTSKKLSDARKEGQVAKSKEIANAFELLALFLVLKFWTAFLGDSFVGVFRNIYTQIPEYIKLYDGFLQSITFRAIFNRVMFRLFAMIGPVLLLGFLVAFICDVVQVKWQPTAKPLQPKFSKLNPVNGFKRIFSLNSLVELIKSLLKIGIIVYAVYSYL